jgi:hypothetical protein
VPEYVLLLAGGGKSFSANFSKSKEASMSPVIRDYGSPVSEKMRSSVLPVAWALIAALRSVSVGGKLKSRLFGLENSVLLPDLGSATVEILERHRVLGGRCDRRGLSKVDAT